MDALYPDRRTESPGPGAPQALPAAEQGRSTWLQPSIPRGSAAAASLFPRAPSQLSALGLAAQVDTKPCSQADVEGVILKISV